MKIVEDAKQVARPLMRLVGKPLTWLESLLPARQLRYRPIFIIGPPRSGTTLIYQAMTHSLAVSYFTNLSEKIPLQYAPAIAAQLARALNLPQNHQTRFESTHGRTSGLSGPSEGGRVWNRWFPIEGRNYVEEGHLTPDQKREMYRAVAGVERTFDTPFVNKNVKHSVRIRALVEVFPSALFIECRRDPLAIAQSIYRARAETSTHREWWSVMPREIDQLRERNPIDQVCGQIYYVQRNIATDRLIIGPDRFLTVHYEMFCRHPNREIERIATFMNDHGAPTRVRRVLPEAFSVSGDRKVDEKTYEALRLRLSELSVEARNDNR